ncbi:MAG: ATP-binding protein [Dehalococcoidia bacterium]|nr:ATP-binding protein [Dehalococcoidia bacterium]
MSTQTSDSKGLHLPDLVIKGFRGIEDLTVSRLGRVNLISGRNGVGKTSLLDAVRIYAARGQYRVLSEILRTREEFSRAIDDDDDETLAPDLESLFHGRGIASDKHISIGPLNERLQLSIRVGLLSQEGFVQQDMFTQESLFEEDLRALLIEFQHRTSEVPISRHLSIRDLRLLTREENELSTGTLCESIGPSILDNANIARFWDRVALTDDEVRAVQALNLMFSDMVERVAIVGDDRLRRPLFGGRRVVVRLKNEESPVPLKSLGDGAVRLFGVALALANSRNGFLLIDEVENGLHYSLQFDFWKMVMKAAHENNVQVFATTHSWDCVRGFAWAASETEEVEGALIRLFNKGGKVKAVEYSERDLKIAAEQGIELR